MKKLYIANIENAIEVENIILTSIEASKKGETIYLMSNGTSLQIIHYEYKEEFEEDGYWVAGIYEYGHRVEA